MEIKTRKYSLMYGGILGLIGIIFFFMLYSLEMHYERDWKIMAVSVLLLGGAIFLGIFNFRKDNGGFLTLGQALKTGIGIALISGIIAILWQQIFMTFIEPEFMDKMMEIQRQALVEDGRLTSKQIDQQMEMGKKFAWVGYAFAILINLFIGFVCSMIIGLILQKRRP
ncbi:MAG: DUF4199 domain-containing protein [Flavobacteriaceae bacterium]|nr:DUF4199 domain-containing protein [Flavobacteriaceae bacterium]